MTQNLVQVLGIPGLRHRPGMIEHYRIGSNGWKTALILLYTLFFCILPTSVAT